MKFREFCHLLQSVFHFEYHDTLETLKDLYAPLNPDRDTRKVGVFTEEPGESFTETLHGLLDKANYELLTQEELEAAFEESSLFQIKLHIDFDAFEEALLFTRGEPGPRLSMMRSACTWPKPALCRLAIHSASPSQCMSTPNC